MTVEQIQNQPVHNQQTGHQQSSQHHQGPLVIFFVFYGLFLGSILRQINKKTKIPYTPMLLVLGIFLGYFRDSLGVIGQSTAIIEQLNPHMILLIFIPVLIFESAFNCDWHVFRKSMLNILILAGPGVLWGAILIGLCFKLILAYPDEELTWYQSFTLGCVLSATDPVAVVALLKQLGASVRFNTLVQGQSLLNDGTAMVFFMLFMDLAKGNASSVAGVLTNFVRVSLGGPLLGIVFGAIMSFWLKKIIRDHVMSINITFFGAFLCFYIAQHTWLKVSGILSIVTLGLYMSAVGKRKIYPQTQHVLHSVWSYIQYSCQTLIFVITGTVVGVEMIRQSTITGWDWVKMILFWFLMILVRVVMVLTFYPILKSSGYGLTKKELVVLIYGGLRGALGLCLALMVGVDDQLPVRFREITVFYMCGMAFFTIVANGLTCKKVVDYVEMIHYPQIKRKLFKRCVKDILQSTSEKMKQIKSDPDLAYAKWKDVQRLANIKNLGSVEHERRTKITLESNISRKSIRDSLYDVKKSEMEEQIRFRFTRYLYKVYWELYEQGQVTQQSIQTLSESCEIVNDNPENRLEYFEVLSRNFTMNTMKYYFYFRDWTFIGPYVTRLLIEKMYYIYEVCIIFIEACQETEHAFHKMLPLDAEHFRNVLDEVKENVQNAINYITEIQNNYPDIMQAVQTSRAATILLNNKKMKLKQMHEQGFIDTGDFEQLRKQIDRDIISIHFSQFKFQDIRFNHILTECPLFSSLSSDQIVKIRMQSTERDYTKGSKIFLKGKQIKQINIIIAGSVKQQYDDFYLIRGLGSVLNPYDFTYDKPSKCVAKASTDVKIMMVKPEVILELLQKEQQFKKRWYKSLFNYSVRHTNSLHFLENNFTEKQMRRFLEASQVKILKSGASQTSQFGAFIFQGQVTCDNARYESEQFISQNRTFKTLSETIILKFNSVVGIEFKNNDRLSVFNKN